MVQIIRKFARGFLKIFFPKLYFLEHNTVELNFLKLNIEKSQISSKVRISGTAQVSNCEIGDYTYISSGSRIDMTKIGKFCSIGPNFFCGWGIHPTNGISTSPMFYSTKLQNGTSLSNSDKIEERKPITIGNDVFIGMNVSVLDGVTIGDGAIIGAGAVVSKDIPPYAIAVGIPIVIKKYRFSENQINRLLNIKWWNFKDDELKNVEEYFFNIDSFIQKYSSKE
jgi:virginiamycin A acetyltransferase